MRWLKNILFVTLLLCFSSLALAQWAQMPANNLPLPAATEVPMVYASGIDRMIMTSGFIWSGSLCDTWTYNSATNQWTRIIAGTASGMICSNGSISPARKQFGMAYDPIRNLVVVFGGVPSQWQMLSDTWILDLNQPSPQWVRVTTPISPPGRVEFSMTYDASVDRIVLYGGGNGLGDTWLFDTSTYTWTLAQQNSAPGAGGAVMFAYDPVHQVNILFGGRRSGILQSDTWIYDAQSNQWTRMFPTVSPPARRYGQLSYAGNGNMMIFGGEGSNWQIQFNDTWSYNLNDNTWVDRTMLSAPPKNKWTAMAYHSGQDNVVQWNNNGMAASRIWTEQLVTTPIPPDTTLPTVSILSPLNNSIVSNIISINATASDNVNVARVQFLVDGNNIGNDTTSPYLISWNTSAWSNGFHTLTARAIDTSNNVGNSQPVLINVQNTADLPPSAPGCIRAVGITSSQIDLTWSASSDESGIFRYIVYRNGQVRNFTTSTSYSDTGLSASTQYTYTIRAQDTSFNIGPASANVTVVTNPSCS